MSGSLQDYLKKYMPDSPKRRHKSRKISRDTNRNTLKIVEEEDNEQWKEVESRKEKKTKKEKLKDGSNGALKVLNYTDNHAKYPGSKWEVVKEVEGDVKELIDSGVSVTFSYDKGLELVEDNIEEGKKKVGITNLQRVNESQEVKVGKEGDSGTLEKEATVYRDKYGRIIDVSKHEKLLVEKRRRLEEGKTEDLIWKRGIKQILSAREEKEKLKRERTSSLAVYRDDQERDKELKKKVHWGDPAGGKLSEKKKRKGKLGLQVYSGPEAPSNRYDILPGYRWDGVDRSNGFERKYFALQNQKIADTEDAYAWLDDDM